MGDRAPADREVAQVFVDDLAAPVLCDDDAQHLTSVLRLRPGEVVAACDGAGSWRRCVVVAGPAPDGGRRRRTPARVVLEPAGDVVVEARPSPEVTVAFALVKGDRPDWAVQKLTELGVDRVVPLLTLRSVVRPGDGPGDGPGTGAGAAERVERLRRVARAAAMQCRRRFLPDVAELTPLAAFLAAHPRCAVASPDGAAPALERPEVVIGPEGGWDEGEIPAGTPSVRLAPHVLRTETAAVVAGSLLVALREGLVRATGPA